MPLCQKSIRESAAKNEAPRPGSGLEWWFLQGSFEGAFSGKRHFMASLFRFRTSAKKQRPRFGHSLLLSILDTRSARNETLTRIDQPLLAIAAKFENKRWRSNLQKEAASAYVKEVRAWGAPAPIEHARRRAVIKNNTLSITWEDFSLSQKNGAFHAGFLSPGKNERYSFTLTPRSPRVFLDPSGSPRPHAMAYATYPSMALSGHIDNEPVHGNAWFDHQWGEMKGWFLSDPAGGSVIGWDWFGINLDNGTELLIMIHREMDSLISVGQFCLCREKGKPPVLTDEFTASPTQYWQSPDTRVRYPVAWSITIPKFSLKLEIHPVIMDQEARLFGMMRAVWEGAAVARGEHDRIPVKGSARVELFGYGYLTSLARYFDRIAERAAACVEKYLPQTLTESDLERFTGPTIWKHDPEAQTQVLSKPVWDLISRKGKYWRPVLGTLLLEALGSRSEPYEMLTAVIPELGHTGALIIDDIEDHSLVRRGQACVHLKYGTAVALNAANALYFLPSQIIAAHPYLSEKQKLELHAIIVRQFSRAHFGQGQDIYWSTRMSKDNLSRWLKGPLKEQILQMYACKTGAIVEGTAEIAAVLAGASPRVRQACASFARVFGVAFQIIDDIHNFADSPEWRKRRGEDILESKLTYVIFRAVTALRGKKRSRLIHILCLKNKRMKSARLDEAIKLIRNSGALKICRKEAQAMALKEWDRLSKNIPLSEPKIMLRALWSQMLRVRYEDATR